MCNISCPKLTVIIIVIIINMVYKYDENSISSLMKYLILTRYKLYWHYLVFSLPTDELEQNMFTRYIYSLEHMSLILYNANYGRTFPFCEWEVVLCYTLWYGSSVFCVFILGKL